jgi:FdhE protein
VGAALQAYFAALAAGLDAPQVEPADTGCPVCGSPPVAGVVRGDDRLRYLSCALCGSEWHLPRVHCAACRGNAGIVHFSVEGDEGAKAEACDLCGGDVKLFDLEKRPGAEPLADDAATLALDLLMAEEGYGRAGVNLLLAASGEPARA